MLKNLPIGIQTFKKIRDENYLYIDKTEQIHRLITSGAYFFLSRPRRSGKSLTLSTIKSIYLGQRELFSGLWIEEQWDWEKIHPVIHISFSGIGYQTQGLEGAIEAELRLIGKQMEIQFEQKGIDRLFAELIRKLSTNGKVVLLIDEYDKPIIDYLGEIEQAQKNQKILKTFYSVIKDCDPYIKFLLITGVSKFSKVSIFSELNNLTDITRNRRFVDLTGYTQAELEDSFAPYMPEAESILRLDRTALLAQLQHWYNGYSWDGRTYVYNPFSILNFFLEIAFRNFWFETGTPSFLLELLREEWLYELDDLTVGEETFSSYDIKHLRAIPILFQTGYLTIKEQGEWGIYTLDYPNAEVKESMLSYLIADLRQREPELTRPMVRQLYEAFNANDMERLITLVKSIFKNIPSHIFLAKAEAYYHSLIYLVFFYLGQYTESEVNTNDGRLDCVVKTTTHVYILEFKLDKSADEALQQIHGKGYADKYASDPRPKILLGINFSSKQKTVDDWKMEEMRG
ncbi:MAG: ATP-binding protein [Chloroflexota bacterium]